MEYTPISPFKRPISYAHLRVIERPVASVPGKPVNKWTLLRELSKAQAAFGVSERDLTVLQGLLSFFPNDALGGDAEMVVFPSNKTICERLNGMPCSTMRRHLSRLVGAGLLMRRDSPNGKRYIRKHGDERVAFGFDLSPLYCRAEEIARAAEAVREAEDRVRRLREIVSLMRRDVAALAEFGEEMLPGLGLWDQLNDTAALIARALRRKLSLDDLKTYRTSLETLLDQARNRIDGAETENMVTNDARFEHHHHNSNKDSIDFEHALENGKADIDEPEAVLVEAEADSEAPDTRRIPKIPLHLVIAGCPSLKTFYPGEIRHWHQLFAAASQVRPAMGISASAWDEAQRCMGPEQASIVVVAMLERFAEIKSPGGYLRALTNKAAAGEFSCGPMVMALMSRRNAA
ncbi:plasmid replication protein RepC [Pseudotabrizicola formosa]|uniref:plasmid replication protein RepC n=1 Tax=Pseudotabrizicola formosa TaxID=2030009 RepID=UPI000CD123F7|nr:plasmid replication protein RepC [Pseudotabrizicola formosa]